VGNVGLSAQQLLDNVNVVMDELLAQLPSHEVIKAVYLHATQGPAFVVFSAPRPPARVSAADEEETN
jgi:ribosomal protein L1